MSAVSSPTELAEAYARTAPKPARQSTPRLARILVYAAAGFALGIAASVTVPVLVGHQAFAVLSGSMEPAIATGDVVVVETIKPLEARVGDIVSFRSPDDAGRILTHRVTAMEAGGDSVSFVTKGDANTGVERWSITAGGTIGRVDYRVPKLGYATNRIGSRTGRFAFLVLPALLLVLTELRRIWRGPGERTSGSEV